MSPKCLVQTIALISTPGVVAMTTFAIVISRIKDKN